MGSHASAQLFFNPPAWPQQVRKPGGTVGHGPHKGVGKEAATLPMPLLVRMQQHQQAAAGAGFKVPPYPGFNLNTVILPTNVHPDVRGVLDEYRTPPRSPVPRNFTPSPLPTAAYARIRATMEHWATNYTWSPGDEGMHYTMIYPHELVSRPCADHAEAKITLPAHFDLQQYATQYRMLDPRHPHYPLIRGPGANLAWLPVPATAITNTTSTINTTDSTPPSPHPPFLPFSRARLCEVLGGQSVLFVGDSLQEHLFYYFAVLAVGEARAVNLARLAAKARAFEAPQHVRANCSRHGRPSVALSFVRRCVSVATGPPPPRHDLSPLILLIPPHLSFYFTPHVSATQRPAVGGRGLSPGEPHVPRQLLPRQRLGAPGQGPRRVHPGALLTSFVCPLPPGRSHARRP